MERSKIILDLVQNNSSLSDSLFRLKLLLSSFDDEEIMSWVNNEIVGYYDDSKIPKYRQIRGTIKCDILHGYQYYYDQYLPISFSDLDALNIITMTCKESVAAIETMIKKDEGEYASIIQSAAYPYLQKYVNGYIQNAKLIFSLHDFSGIYSSIKNKILDILLLLEKNGVNLDSYDFNLDKEQKKNIIPVIIQIVYKDNSIRIGSKNKISNSDIIVAEHITKSNNNKTF